MDANTQEPARVISSRRGWRGNDDITIGGLREQERERLEGMVLGHWWARGGNGRIEFSPGHIPAPPPVEDPMLPEWRASGAKSTSYQTELFNPDVNWAHQSPSIIIQHLCGYSCTPEGYKANAEFLEECGFMGMRSRRSDEGKYWELWFLPGLWVARGRMKEALNGVKKEEQLKVALELILRWTSFGTLDVAVQRMYQVMD